MSGARDSKRKKLKLGENKIYTVNRFLPTLHKEIPLKVNTISPVWLLTTFFTDNNRSCCAGYG